MANKLLIPVEELNEKEIKIIDKLLRDFYKEGKLFSISDERNKEIEAEAQKRGLNQKETERIVKHFNAASDFSNRRPEIKKKIIKQLEDNMKL